VGFTSIHMLVTVVAQQNAVHFLGREQAYGLLLCGKSASMFKNENTRC